MSGKAIQVYCFFHGGFEEEEEACDLRSTPASAAHFTQILLDNTLSHGYAL